MKRTLWTLLLVVTLVVGHIATLSKTSAADFSAVWNGGTGNWSDPLHWNTNPNYPNNGGAVTYDATINGGGVLLDRNITIQRLFFNGGDLDGAFELTLNEGLTWNAYGFGFIIPITINLAAGSTSNIASGGHGLNSIINNSGTMQTTASSGLYLLDPAVINNLAGATWNLGFGINPNGPMILPSVRGQFNNAGNLLVSAIVSPINPVNYLRTTFNNSGSVTIGDSANLFISKGSASGAFNLGTQATLTFGDNLLYTLTSGATINGAGVTTISGVVNFAGTSIRGTLDVTGDVTIGTNVVNHGILLVRAGANLTLNGSLDQSPVPSLSLSSGITQLDGGAITSAQPLSLHNGTLAGRGTINANVVSDATIAPGASAGKIAINGALSLLSGSTLVMEIGGLTQGTQYDYLAISGMVSLDGRLELNMLNGFELQLDPSQIFTILTSKSLLSGEFDNVANGGRLVTADGTASFQVNYGKGSPYGANNVVLSDPLVVPEPASLVLFAAGAAVLGLFRFRRR